MNSVPVEQFSHLGPGRSRVSQTLLTGAALVICVAGFRQVPSIGPLLLAVVLVVMAWPVAEFLRKKNAPNWLAMIALMSAAFSMLVVVIGAVVYSVGELVVYLASADLDSSFASITTQIQSFMKTVGLEQAQLESMMGSINISAVATQIARTASGAFSWVSVMSIVVVSMLFIAMDAGGFVDRLNDSLAETRPHLRQALSDFATQTRSYFVVATVFGAIVAVLDGIALMIIGVPLVWTWVVLSLITNYIPNIGFVLGLVPPAVVAVVEKGPMAGVWVVIAYFVLNTVVQTVIQPKIVGDTLGLSATVTFVSLIFWAYVVGTIGTLIAVPLTLFVRAVLVDHDPAMQWLKPMISLNPQGEDPPEAPDELQGSSRDLRGGDRSAGVERGADGSLDSGEKPDNDLGSAEPDGAQLDGEDLHRSGLGGQATPDEQRNSKRV